MKTRPPHPREQCGGGVLRALENRETSPFPAPDSGVALTMEEAKGRVKGVGAGAGPLEVSQGPLPSRSQPPGGGTDCGAGPGALPRQQGDGQGLSQATPRVRGPDPQAQFGKIWGTPSEHLRSQVGGELGGGCASVGRPESCMGGGHWWQNVQNCHPRGLLCGLAALRDRALPPSTLSQPWPGPAFKV